MSELVPAGWTRMTLRELVGDGVFVDGDWVESKDQDPNGAVRLIQLADVGAGRFTDKSARFLTAAKAAQLGCTFLEAGDVLVSRMASPIGRACIFPGAAQRCVTVVDVCIIRPNAQRVDSRWLTAMINAPQFRESVELASSGTTRTRVSRGNLGSLELPFPPLKEQRRIVAKLEVLQAHSRRAHHALGAVRSLIDKLRQSILAAAFRGDLTRAWRAKHKDATPARELLKRIRVERRAKWEKSELAKMAAKGKTSIDDTWKGKYKEPVAHDGKAMPKLPEGWCWAPFPLLLSTTRVGMRTGPFGSLLGRDDYVADGIPIVGVENIGRMEFHRKLKHSVRAAKAAELAEYSIQEGDLLVSRSGTVGEVCVVPRDAGPGIISTNTIRVCVDSNVVNPVVLGFALIGSSHVLSQIRALCSGSTRDFLNQSILSELYVPLPSHAEQRELLRVLDGVLGRCGEFERLVGPTSESLSFLERSILSKAFRGELVSPDSD